MRSLIDLPYSKCNNLVFKINNKILGLSFSYIISLAIN